MKIIYNQIEILNDNFIDLKGEVKPDNYVPNEIDIPSGSNSKIVTNTFTRPSEGYDALRTTIKKREQSKRRKERKA